MRLSKLRHKLVNFVDKFFLSKVETQLLIRGVLPFWMRSKALVNSFTLVVPCYNVESYIDAFLTSLVTQTSGLKNLEVLLIDDGSTDRTASIAQSWAAKYQDVIRYHRQDNQGLCGARNTGLRLATGDWISFPDPDDFFHHRYLQHVDAVITKGLRRKISIVCCNFIRFFEKDGKINDNHQLNYRFREGLRWIPAKDLGEFMQLAINSAFVRRLDLVKMGITFDPLIVPGFEDANVVNRYLVNLPKTTAAFVPAAKYFYRKRADESSLQDTARTKKAFYLNQPRYGWLPLLEEAVAKRKRVPHFIQRTVLYDTIGHFRTNLKRPQTLDFLSTGEKAEYAQTMKRAFSFIDPEIVKTTKLPGLFEDLRTGILNLYFKQERTPATVYVTQFDLARQLVRISFHSPHKVDRSKIFAAGKPLEKTHYKAIRNTFVGETFFFEHTFWVPWHEGSIKAKISGTPAKITIKPPVLKTTQGRSYLLGPTGVDELLRANNSPKAKDLSRYLACWVVMDRIDKADDNGEHFYRYLQKHQPQINAFFVLTKRSPDWSRLSRSGFKLIEYGSRSHAAAMKQASLLISSHADRFIRNPFPSDHHRYKFAFIQHGVTKDDQSEWFNNIMPSILATATTDEFQSIVDPQSNYHLTSKEVVLSGFPRYDALAALPTSSKTIFIMPTWREHLCRTGINGQRTLKDGFEQSLYSSSWNGLLSSERLRHIAESNGLKIVFCPHPNFSGQLHRFNIPPHVSTIMPTEIDSLQPYFAEMAVMVSDFSSVTFDAGFLDKPVVYYQFDESDFFQGHIYRPGYFTYREKGFGPVVDNEADAIDAIENAVTGSEAAEFRRRRQLSFPLKDGKASDRIFKSLVEIV
jgi:glycosyltransferase involved in cell wall biosynthesis